MLRRLEASVSSWVFRGSCHHVQSMASVRKERAMPERKTRTRLVMVLVVNLMEEDRKEGVLEQRSHAASEIDNKKLLQVVFLPDVVVAASCGATSTRLEAVDWPAASSVASLFSRWGEGRIKARAIWRMSTSSISMVVTWKSSWSAVSGTLGPRPWP